MKCQHIITNLVHSWPHLLLNALHWHRSIQPLRIPDLLQRDKILKTDSRKQLFNGILLIRFLLIFKFFHLLVDHSYRFVYNSNDLINLCFKFIEWLHILFFSPYTFIIQCLFQLVKCCSVCLGILNLIICIYKRLIKCHFLSQLCFQFLIIEADFFWYYYLIHS